MRTITLSAVVKSLKLKLDAARKLPAILRDIEHETDIATAIKMLERLN